MTAEPNHGRPIHVCIECLERMNQIEMLNASELYVLIRCPNCGWELDTALTPTEMENYKTEFHRGTILVQLSIVKIVDCPQLIM